MKNFWILIITATLLSLPYRSSSSTERFRLLDTGNGLFNNQVRFLTQMEDGKILVCTEGMFIRDIFFNHKLKASTLQNTSREVHTSTLS